MKQALTGFLVVAAIFAVRAYIAWAIAGSSLPPWFKFWLLH